MRTKKEKKYIMLGGEEFLYKGKIDLLDTISSYNHYYSLYECYNKPSEAKHYIYNYYEELLQKNCDRVNLYGISSYNCNFIILNATIQKDGVNYYVYITPSHNYIYEIEVDL